MESSLLPAPGQSVPYLRAPLVKAASVVVLFSYSLLSFVDESVFGDLLPNLTASVSKELAGALLRSQFWYLPQKMVCGLPREASILIYYQA